MIAAELRYSMMDLMAAALGNATFADGEWRVEGVSVGVMASKGIAVHPRRTHTSVQNLSFSQCVALGRI